jgi:hypothetical protein
MEIEEYILELGSAVDLASANASMPIMDRLGHKKCDNI